MISLTPYLDGKGVGLRGLYPSYIVSRWRSLLSKSSLQPTISENVIVLNFIYNHWFKIWRIIFKRQSKDDVSRKFKHSDNPATIAFVRVQINKNETNRHLFLTSRNIRCYPGMNVHVIFYIIILILIFSNFYNFKIYFVTEKIQ